MESITQAPINFFDAAETVGGSTATINPANNQNNQISMQPVTENPSGVPHAQPKPLRRLLPKEVKKQEFRAPFGPLLNKLAAGSIDYERFLPPNEFGSSTPRTSEHWDYVLGQM
jgi:hypothetical protein